MTIRLAVTDGESLDTFKNDDMPERMYQGSKERKQEEQL